MKAKYLAPLAAAVALSAQAQDPNINPGMWETTSTVTIESEQFPIPPRSDSSSDCVTAEDIAEGQAFLQRCREAVEHVRTGRALMEAASDEVRGELRVSASPVMRSTPARLSCHCAPRKLVCWKVNDSPEPHRLWPLVLKVRSYWTGMAQAPGASNNSAVSANAVRNRDAIPSRPCGCSIERCVVFESSMVVTPFPKVARFA